MCKAVAECFSGFDNAGVFYSDNFNGEEQDTSQINNQAIKKRFKEFLRQFNESNFHFKYRDALKKNYNLRQYFVEVNIEDLSSFDDTLADKLYKNPTEMVPLFEEAATEVADEITSPRPEGEEEVEKIQVMLFSEGNPCSIRDLSAEIVSRLVKIPGIVVAASGMKAKATRISIQCRSCRTVIPNIDIKPGLDSYALPRKCNTEQAGRPKCPLDPFFIMPDKCRCVDFQILKLQETPDSVPHGEMPRHM
jgi:DNA replication licensing factor MCM5